MSRDTSNMIYMELKSGGESCSVQICKLLCVWVSFPAEALPDFPLLVCGTQTRAEQAQPGFWSPAANVSLQRACSQSGLHLKVDVK